MWILENGEFASVYCVSIGKDGGRLSYRFVDTCIKNPGDIPICFEDLESGFAEIIEAEKEGREPYLPQPGQEGELMKYLIHRLYVPP